MRVMNCAKKHSSLPLINLAAISLIWLVSDMNYGLVNGLVALGLAIGLLVVNLKLTIR